jgi:hypothetical protein
MIESIFELHGRSLPRHGPFDARIVATGAFAGRVGRTHRRHGRVRGACRTHALSPARLTDVSDACAWSSGAHSPQIVTGARPTRGSSTTAGIRRLLPSARSEAQSAERARIWEEQALAFSQSGGGQQNKKRTLIVYVFFALRNLRGEGGILMPPPVSAPRCPPPPKTCSVAAQPARVWKEVVRSRHVCIRCMTHVPSWKCGIRHRRAHDEYRSEVA